MTTLADPPYPALRGHWQPVLREADLRDRPVAVQLWGQDLVLARLDGAPRCFLDRCPHRGVPLSAGQVVAGGTRLACCYHGWQFAADGRLVHTPGARDCAAQAALRRVPLQVADGLIWVNPDGDLGAPLGFRPLPEHRYVQAYRVFDAGLFASVENVLDPCHTATIHRGILRSTGPQRMTLEQRVHDSGFVTTFQMLDRQNGLVSRVFDRGVNRNEGSFTMPGRVELDYLQGERIQLRVAIWFVPVAADRTGLWVRLHVPRSVLPAWLRYALFRPFIATIFRQDNAILRAQQRARDTHGEHYIFAATDLVAQPLWALLHGDAPQATSTTELLL